MFRAMVLVAALAASAAGHAGDGGATPSEIRLGASAVLSGPLGPQTREYGVGSRMYFDAVNAAGGVHGRKISYTTLDDGFDPKRAVDNTRKLITEDGVFLIYHNTGTAQTAAILPLLEETRTVVFGPVTGASVFRDKFNRLLFNVRASYANEARRILSQLKQGGLSRGIILAQIMPSLRNMTIPVVAEYHKLLQAKSPGAVPSATQFEGFVHAKLLVGALRRAGPTLTTESFIRAMEGGGDVTFGRFVAKYSAQSHNGSSYVELAIIDYAGQLRY